MEIRFQEESMAMEGGKDELDFVNLVLLLGNTANLELGHSNDKGQHKERDLPRARGIINMLASLQVKTEGRRTPHEETLLASILLDLREKYVDAAGLRPPSLGTPSWAAQQYSKQAKK